MSKTVVTGTFGATGQSAAIPVKGFASVLIENGVGTVQIERSFDDGSNWYPISKNSDGDVASYVTASDLAYNGTVQEPMFGVQYRLNCTAYTSGSINYRIASAP